MDEYLKKIIEGLNCYCLGMMAKDLSGRYPNPGRVIRNVGSITETMQQLTTGQANPLLSLLQGVQQPVAPKPVAPTEVEAPKPLTFIKHDKTKLDAKEFYKFTKESKEVMNAILNKVDLLAPPPAAK